MTMLKWMMIVQTPHSNPAPAPEDTAARVMETLKSVGMRAMIFYFVMQFFRKPATTPGIEEFSRLKPVYILYFRRGSTWKTCQSARFKPLH